MPKVRAAARGITGDTTVAMRRTASSSRYRKSSSSVLRAWSLAISQGAMVTIRWLSWETHDQTSPRAPE